MGKEPEPCGFNGYKFGNIIQSMIIKHKLKKAEISTSNKLLDMSAIELLSMNFSEKQISKIETELKKHQQHLKIRGNDMETYTEEVTISD